jgi:hypothetical protein
MHTIMSLLGHAYGVVAFCLMSVGILAAWLIGKGVACATPEAQKAFQEGATASSEYLSDKLYSLEERIAELKAKRAADAAKAAAPTTPPAA